MCASPPSPRHAQPDWMGGGLASRQMMHARASVAMSVRSALPAWARRQPGIRCGFDPLRCPEDPCACLRPARPSAWGGHGGLSCNRRLCCFERRSTTAVQQSFEPPSFASFAMFRMSGPGMRRLRFACLAFHSFAVPDAPNGLAPAQSSSSRRRSTTRIRRPLAS